MPDETNTERAERVDREGEDAMMEALTEAVDERAERLKHCAAALRTAGVPLADWLTASVLHELAEHVSSLLAQAESD